MGMNIQKRQMLQQITKQHSLGALILWRPDELVLALGYMPLWGLSFLIYTRDDEPVLYVPEFEPEDILPDGIEIKRFPWGKMDCANPWEYLYSEIKALLRKKGNHKYPVSFIKNIGGTAPCRMSGEQPQLPADLIEQLISLSDLGYKDVTDSLLKCYLYKSEEDVRRLKVVHEIAALAVNTFYANVQTGKTEVEIAATIEFKVQQATGKNHIQFAKAWPLIQSGMNVAFGGRYNRTTGKMLQRAELVLLEMSICVDGYWADISRTASTGETTGQQKLVYDTVLEAQRIAISLMKPGIAMHEIDFAARSYIEKAGFGHLYNHALGHHVCFRYHDPGAVLSPNSTGVLEEGMLLTVEPGIYGEEIKCGVRVEDNVLITKDGCQVLSDYYRGLIRPV
jgi:Xaa-Pro dipeptidase